MNQAVMRIPQDVPKILLVAGHSRRPPVRRARPAGDPKLAGVLALVEGLRAGKAQLDRLRIEAKEAVAKAKAERRAETRTKLVAFFLFDLMAGALLFAGYAGITG